MQKIVTSSNGNSRFHILDASRFFAAISVVLFHFLFLSWSGNHTNSISFHVIGEFFKYGYLGVQFFFLISGFVIFMSIQRGGVIDFLASRAARLYPAYWFSVLLTSFFIFSFFHFPLSFSICLFFTDSLNSRTGEEYKKAWKKYALDFQVSLTYSP